MEKRVRSYNMIIFIALLLMVFFLIQLLLQERSSISETITTVTAALGVFAIWHEMKRSKDLAEAEFIINLNKSFVENKNMNAIYYKLEKYRNKSDKEVFDESEIPSIVQYLTFYETIYGLLRRNLLKIEIIDDLFAYRFFLIVHNEEVQRKELIKDRKYYKNIYMLHDLWTNYREKNKLDIIMPLSSLRLKCEDYYEFAKKKI